MGNAKIISMRAQPAHVSYLCFDMSGILDTCNVELGKVVDNVPFFKLSDYVKSSGTQPGDPSRLKCDSGGVAQIVNHFSLATLRNEDRRASLDSAVNTRQNIYFSKYANSASIIATIRQYYSAESAASKPNRLELLGDIAERQAVQLQEAYAEDDRVGVVKATSSSLQTKTHGGVNATRAGKFYQESAGMNVGKGAKMPRSPPHPAEGMNSPPAYSPWSGYQSMRFTTTSVSQVPVTTGVNYEESCTLSNIYAKQSSTHVDYEYRTPSLEAEAKNNRAQISLMDQRFESFMFQQNMPHLEQIFANELASIDNDVYLLQLALLRSFLISPIPGIITGIYKNPGDAVNAREPVMRVESNRVVHLIADLVHHGAITLGATATVTTILGEATSPPTTVTGNVVAARGLGSGSHWEVIVKIINQSSGGSYILPLGYCFDPEYTQVAIA